MNRLWLGLGSVLALIAISAYFWLRQAPAPQPPPPAAVVAAPAVAPAKPTINYPLPEPRGTAELPPIGQSDAFVRERMAELLSAQNIKTHLVIEEFVRRVAATVDNLARPFAPPGKWPFRQTPGRFTVDTGADGSVIAANNAARYRPFVALVESVDTERGAAVYRQLYPLFQRAYEDLGYPGKYFNDRLVAMIDLLLATPEPSGALKVEMPEIRGPLKPAQPWVLYRYSDPALEGLSSGQKILLRVGTDNAKRLKAKLAAFRKAIAGEKAGR